MKIWERRLMKDFHVAPITMEDDTETINEQCEKPLDKGIARFRRVAHKVVSQTASRKWDDTVKGVTADTQIGRCNNRLSYKNQQNLQKAMIEAQR